MRARVEKRSVLGWNKSIMKDIYALVLLYMCVYMYICRGIYLFVTYVYVGYICIFVFTCRVLRQSVSVLFYGLMWRIFILVVTALICRFTFPFFHVWFFIRAFEWGFGFINCFVYDSDFFSKSVIVVDSSNFLTDDVFLFALVYADVYLQTTTWLIRRIVSWLKNSWPGLMPLFLVYVYCTPKAAAARISIHGSDLST